MDRDSITTAAVILFLALLPAMGIVYAGYKAKPKDQITPGEIYPDPHLFV